MLKRKIIRDIYRKNRSVSRAVIRQIIDEYIEIQKIALLNEGKIYLGDMCILKLVDVQARRYFNPSSGEYYIKPKHKRVMAVVRHSMNDALTKKYPPVMPKVAKSKKNSSQKLKKKKSISLLFPYIRKMTE